MSRVVVWFSCGAASAVTARLAVDKYSVTREVVVAYCDTSESEHPDNLRFLADVERWIGQPILKLRSEKYATVDEVFEQTRYMSGPYGARCTVELKKVPRFEFQQPDDLHLFGLTVDEGDRIARLENNNPELALEWILRDQGVTKEQCYLRLMDAGIVLPAMYRLGYANNNCPGCVKSESPGYWSKIREDFPDVFALRASQSRELGVRLVELRGKRIYLDELPPGRFPYARENMSCGPDCSIQLDLSGEAA
jgi:hypothetical protein